MKRKAYVSILYSILIVLASGELFASQRKAIHAVSGLTGKRSQPTANEKAMAKNYACTLLSNADIQREQGEAVNHMVNRLHHCGDLIFRQSRLRQLVECQFDGSGNLAA